VDLLGPTLLSKSGEVSTEKAIAGKAAVAIYFSAHWCPPCRGFTPQLAEWYMKSLSAKGLEIIFVSADRDSNSFEAYFKDMPWLAMPFEDQARNDALSKRFNIQGIPALVILDAEGRVITTDGRSEVSNDPTGANLRWLPKPSVNGEKSSSEADAPVPGSPGATLLSSEGKQSQKMGAVTAVLSTAKLVNREGQQFSAEEALRGKTFALYFSAHWCPPCRGFTPKLAEWYSKNLKAKGLEVVFVSSDQNQSAFEDYYKEMPWLALDFADRKRKEELCTLCQVQGIPSFVIVGPDGEIINKNGRAAVSADPEGKNFPWRT